MFKRYLFIIVPSLLVLAGTPACAAAFFQGFEIDNSGWNIFGGMNDAVRVASGTHGVTSRTGSFHGEAMTGDLEKDSGSAVTRWGGYNMSFTAGMGYITSADIYLNVGGTFNNDTRFDWDSAVNDLTGSFRRDFLFNAGFYNNTDATGSGARFVVSAGNNAGRGSSFPENPGHDPFAITQTGWYTFQHYFHNVAGVLAVDLSIINSGGTTLHTWHLSDPSDLAANCCANRYGWFDLQEFPFLAIDNTLRSDITATPEPSTFLLLGGGLLAFAFRLRRG